jgi:hypothetical protein
MAYHPFSALTLHTYPPPVEVDEEHAVEAQKSLGEA